MSEPNTLAPTPPNAPVARALADSRILTPDDVLAVVRDTPNITPARGRTMMEFIYKHGIRNALELGFNHGVSTSYIAAAVSDRVVTIDRARTLANKPSVEQHLEQLNLREKVCVFYEHTTYNWRLRDFLRMDPQPVFDLCFIDGAHTWEVDGFAFLLAMRLLQPGGFIIFDDYSYNFATSEGWNSPRGKKTLDAMPEDEKTTCHIREVFDLLVKPHPDVAEAWDDVGWAYARKHGKRSGGIDETLWVTLNEKAATVYAHAKKQAK